MSISTKIIVFSRCALTCLLALCLLNMSVAGAQDPPTDFGDAPESIGGSPTGFSTTVGNNGARHVQIIEGPAPNIFCLGASVDPDSDGQPSPAADGDDLDGQDDEDGVTFNPPLVPGSMAQITVSATLGSFNAGYLNAWVDFNRDLDWNDPGEQIFTDQLLVAGPNNLQFQVPAAAVFGPTYARFRLAPPNPPTAVNPYGPWEAGEVEDYLILIGAAPSGDESLAEYGDAPEGSSAIAYPPAVSGAFPSCVNALAAGPAGFVAHQNFGVFFGPTYDFEADGNAALCPPPNCFPPYDQDECFQDGDAGLLFPEPFSINNLNAVVTCPGSSGTSLGVVNQNAQWGTAVDIQVLNFMPGHAPFLNATVNVLMDWNQNGRWGDANEHVLVNFPVPALYAGPLSGLNPPDFQLGPNPGYVWTRFTISEKSVPMNWSGNGTFEDGETEDYLLQVQTAAPPPPPTPSIPTLSQWGLMLLALMLLLAALFGIRRRRLHERKGF